MAPPPESVKAMFSLTSRHYIVTGGAQGIGYACTRAICEMGGSVAVLDIQPEPAEKEFHSLASQFGVQTFYFQTDVTDQASLENGFAKAIDALGGRLDGLVPAAGIAIDKPFVDQTWEEFTRIQEINGRGLFFSCQLAAKHMMAHPLPTPNNNNNTTSMIPPTRSLLLLASQTSHIAIPGHRMAAYNYSKGGVLMLTKALAAELAPHNIRVNSISPGYVDSDMLQRVKAAKVPAEARMMEISPPMKRLSNANDLVGAVVYLLSEAARFTTGADVRIDGGLTSGTVDGLIYYEREK